MFLIFEGPDCGGKSTLIEAIAQTDSWAKVHHGPYLDLDADHLMGKYIQAMNIARNGANLLMDRSWLSEPIYGKVFRDGKNRLNEFYTEILESTAASLDARIVLCIPPWQTVKYRWLERKGVDSDAEYLDRVEQLKKVYDAYDDLFFTLDTCLPIIRHDYTSRSTLNLKEIIAC